MEQPNALVKIALNDVIQQVNAGSDPTSALKKTASELDLNPNYVHRVGEALNVALHYNHFKTASDRSAHFDIANITEVVSDLFGGKEKTANQYVSENFGVTDADDTVFNYNRMLSNPRYKKAYMEIISSDATEESYGLSFKGAYEKSANVIRDLEQTLDNHKTAAAGAEFELNREFSKLASHFAKDAGYRTAFDEFESQVYAKHGEKATPYLDLLYKTSGITEDRGVHDGGYMTFEPSKELGMFDTLLQKASELIESQEQLKIAEENYTFEKEYFSEIGKLVANNGRLSKAAFDESEEPEIKKKDNLEKEEEQEALEESDPVLAKIQKRASLKKEAIIGKLFTVGNLLNKSNLKENLLKSFGERYTGSFGRQDGIGNTPRANLTMENMERQLLLQELMLTDPILSKVSPQKVAKAYEQILRLSPQVSKEKEVVRAMLRQAVASQAVAPHEADQWTKLDTDILKRKMVSDSYLRGRTEGLKF